MEDEPRTSEPHAAEAEEKQSWQEPKLVFIEPTLTPHGPLHQVTGGFFGAFSP